MKIHVKNATAGIITSLIYTAPRTAMYFAAAFLGASFILPALFQTGIENLSFVIGLLSFGVLAVVIIRQVIDSILHAKNTSVELTENNISCEVSGFNTETFAIPLNRISSVRVSQAFLDKFFGVGSIVISQVAGTFSVYGFDYTDAKKFAKKFSEKQYKTHERD